MRGTPGPRPDGLRRNIRRAEPPIPRRTGPPRPATTARNLALIHGVGAERGEACGLSRTPPGRSKPQPKREPEHRDRDDAGADRDSHHRQPTNRERTESVDAPKEPNVASALCFDIIEALRTAVSERQMFGNPRYNRFAKWRNDPATDWQLEKLVDLNVEAPKGLTKGEASDLISKSLPPAPEEIEFLKVFGIELPKSATQHDAALRIGEITSDRANKAKWRARPATKDQLRTIKEVEGKIPPGITFVDADKRIAAYEDDPEKNERYQDLLDREDAEEQQKIDEENRREYIKEIARCVSSGHGIKRVSGKLVGQAIANMEKASGKSLDDLSDDVWFFERIAEEVRRLDPSKTNKEFGRNPEYFQPWVSPQPLPTVAPPPMAPNSPPEPTNVSDDQGRPWAFLFTIVGFVILGVMVKCTAP